jgi:hypothetical protein
MRVTSTPGKSFLSGALITSDKFQIPGIPENMHISWSDTMILAVTLELVQLQNLSEILPGDFALLLFSILLVKLPFRAKPKFCVALTVLAVKALISTWYNVKVS